MRLWVDPTGAIVPDERLLSFVGAYGSLSEAALHGEFTLINGAAPCDSEDAVENGNTATGNTAVDASRPTENAHNAHLGAPSKPPRRARSLADYLAEE